MPRLHRVFSPEEAEELAAKRAYRHDVICGGLLGGGPPVPCY